MKYAVLRIKGRQYKVCEGDELLIDKAEKDVAYDVLLYVNDKKVEIGNPFVKNVEVTVKVLGEEKGKKIDVLKYKAKSRYRKHIGFRPSYSRISIAKISEK
jgi:large subunit ribosomal protein L21